MGWTDVRTDRWTHPVHFWPTSGSLPVRLGTMGGHMRNHSYSLPKKMTCTKFAHGQTEKKVTSKDPFRDKRSESKKTHESQRLYTVSQTKVFGYVWFAITQSNCGFASVKFRFRRS